jgi:hypothetical protein
MRGRPFNLNLRAGAPMGRVTVQLWLAGPGVPMPNAAGWIGEVRIPITLNRASHQSPDSGSSRYMFSLTGTIGILLRLWEFKFPDVGA